MPSRSDRSDDAALAEVADRQHDLGGVAAQAVDADDHDGVAGAGVVEHGGQTRRAALWSRCR